MRHSFGKPAGKVARIEIGQVMISVRCKDVHQHHAIEALRRAKFKFPGRQKVSLRAARVRVRVRVRVSLRAARKGGKERRRDRGGEGNVEGRRVVRLYVQFCPSFSSNALSLVYVPTASTHHPPSLSL
jgi:hypothetical protein